MSVDPIPLPAWTQPAAVPPPAPEPPRDRAALVLGIGQVLAALCLAAGVYLLAGLGWALAVMGGLGLVLLLAVDYLRSRPAPEPAPGPGGDR